MYTDFGNRMYASSREPLSMAAFNIRDTEQKWFSGLTQSKPYQQVPFGPLTVYTAWEVLMCCLSEQFRETQKSGGTTTCLASVYGRCIVSMRIILWPLLPRVLFQPYERSYLGGSSQCVRHRHRNLAIETGTGSRTGPGTSLQACVHCPQALSAQSNRSRARGRHSTEYLLLPEHRCPKTAMTGRDTFLLCSRHCEQQINQVGTTES